MNLFCQIQHWFFMRNKRTLNFGEVFTVRMVSSLTSMDSTAALHAYNHIFFSFLVKSNLVKLETNYTGIFNPNGECSLV